MVQEKIVTGEGEYQCFGTKSSLGEPIIMGDIQTKDNTLQKFNTITAFVQNYCDIESKKGQELLSIQPISSTYFMVFCVLNNDFKNLL